MAEKPGPAKNGYVLSNDKFQHREKVFGIYRDMGAARSLSKLHVRLHDTYPEFAVSRSSLEHWSKMHDWVSRVKAFDDAARPGAQAARSRTRPKAAAAPATSVDEDFDMIGALLKSANQALTRAMNAAPVVTRPSEVKSLVDAAANALKLIEKIKNQSSGKVSREEIAREMARALGEVHTARLHDIEQADKEIKARLTAIGLWNQLTDEQRAAVSPDPAMAQKGKSDGDKVGIPTTDVEPIEIGCDGRGPRRPGEAAVSHSSGDHAMLPQRAGARRNPPNIALCY
jgi:hypothetical protein